MKTIKFWIAMVFASMLFIGCGGSSSSIYLVKPTPLKEGSTMYSLKSLKVNLLHGHGRNEENKTFATQEELEKSFADDIIKYMNNEKIYSDKANYLLDVEINYTRIYNYGGNALNKPEFIYTIKIYDQSDKLLVNYSIPKSTTNFGGFTDHIIKKLSRRLCLMHVHTLFKSLLNFY